jgi:chromosome segregation ATPase
MKLVYGLVSTLGMATALAACTTTKKDEDKKPEISAEEQAAQTRAQSATQAQQTIAQFNKQRAQYRLEAENKLNDLEAKIAALKAGAPVDPQARAANMETVRGLEDQLASARSNLAELQDATIDDWGSRQQQVEQSILLVQSGYEAAKARLAH